jgi:hypothetical protein
MKINELIAESQVDEGLGSMIGKGVGALAKGVGATVGGAVGAWDAAKKGYAAGKATVAGDLDPAAPAAAPAQGGTQPATPPAQGAAPAQGGTQPATPPAQGAAPAQGGSAPAAAPNSGELGGIMQAIDKLDRPTKQQLAGELEKSIAGGGQPAPAGMPPQGSPVTAPGATPAPGAPPAGGTAPTTPPAGGTAPTTPPAGGTAPTTPPAGGTAPTTPPAGGKLTQAQQDAMKAKLQGKRAAGQTTASQTGSGFKDYVGGSQTKLTGADAQGNPVFKKLQRESVAFSNFLGVHI